MTTKVLTGAYPAGYLLQAPITTLSVAASGYVGGSGVATAAVASYAYTVVNDGSILADDSAGVAGVSLSDGGVVTNGALSDTAATISGYRGVNIDGARGSVTNYGTIDGLTRSAIRLGDGGAITNGARHDTRALIESEAGLAAISIDRRGQVHNFGTIDLGIQFIYLAGGIVTNGGVGSEAASIVSTGGTGVYFAQGEGRVRNFGLIQVAHGPGVFLGGGGRVTNGEAADPVAVISGYVGVELRATGAVANFGTIEGGAGAQGLGVLLAAGGTLRNGNADDSAALISGYDGVVLGARGKVTNYGTIEATGGRTQRPAGGEAAQPGVGVFLTGGGGYGYIRNGSATNQSAVIEGYLGVTESGGYAKVDNFGTIIGTSGIALKFTGLRNTLIVESGCVFEGAVEGGGGVLELGSGTATVRGLNGGGVITLTQTVSGGVTRQKFDDFNSLIIDRGAGISSVHTMAVAKSQTIVSAGGAMTLGDRTSTLTNAGILGTLLQGSRDIDSSRVIIRGALDNTGELAVEGGLVSVEGPAVSTGYVYDLLGKLAFHSTFTGDIVFQSGSALYLARSQTYSGTLDDDEYVFTDELDLGDIGFVSAGEATLSGGVLTVTDGTHSAHLKMGEQFVAEAVTFVASSDGHGGVIVTATGHHPGAQPGSSTPPPHALVSAMAALGASPGHAIHASEIWSARQPTLSAPRVMTA